MNRNILETLMGAIVIVVAAGFMLFAYEGSAVKVEDGYPVIAKFENASGITVGSDVMLGGIKIGVVSTMELDNATYKALVTLLIQNKTKLPEDSSASIASAGLLGSKFVQLVPGASDDMLEKDGEIEYTQSSVSLEELIGKFVFSGGGVDEETSE